MYIVYFFRHKFHGITSTHTTILSFFFGRYLCISHNYIFPAVRVHEYTQLYFPAYEFTHIHNYIFPAYEFTHIHNYIFPAYEFTHIHNYIFPAQALMYTHYYIFPALRVYEYTFAIS